MASATAVQAKELVLVYEGQLNRVRRSSLDSLSDFLLVLPIRLFLTCSKVPLTHIEEYTSFVHFQEVAYWLRRRRGRRRS
jgi:hypothetical protein